MELLMFAIGFLMMMAAIVWLGISLLRKSGLKLPGYLLGAGFVLFFISLFFPGLDPEPSTPAVNTASETVETEENEAEEPANTEQKEQESPDEKETAEQAAKEKKKEQEQAEIEAKKQAEQEQKEKEQVAAKKEAEKRKAEEARKQAEKEAKAKKEAEAKAKKEAETKAAAEKEKEEQKQQTNATVTRVVDGDTLEISMNGTTEDVRLLLIDTPETVHPNEPVQPFGPEASQFVKNQLTGKEVYVKVGSEERDHYGRLLAYVFIDGETIQEKLLSEGLARTAYLYNDLTMLDQFHAAQQPAKASSIGVWSIPGYAHVDHDHGYHYEEQVSAPAPEPAPEPQPQPEPEPDTGSSGQGLAFDPNGPDRDCGDFSTQASAQAFMEASGSGDPHRLDGNDNDGLACESLP